MIVNHLPTLLAERRLKVADAVRATGVSKTTLHKIYNDQSSRIDFDTIDKLCEYLEVEVKKRVLILMVFKGRSRFGHHLVTFTFLNDLKLIK